jgi:hypothetical protein
VALIETVVVKRCTSSSVPNISWRIFATACTTGRGSLSVVAAREDANNAKGSRENAAEMRPCALGGFARDTRISAGGVDRRRLLFAVGHG